MLEIPMPEAGMAVNTEEAVTIANRIGYPVMVRPSFVLSGRGMEVVHDEEDLRYYMQAAVGVTPDRLILIDRFLHHATECEADAISDGTNVLYPPLWSTSSLLRGYIRGFRTYSGLEASDCEEQGATIKDLPERLQKEMNVVGLMNMQYAIEDRVVWCSWRRIQEHPEPFRCIQGMQY